MERKALSGIMLTVLLASLVTVSVPVPVQSSPSPVTFYVDMPPEGYIPGVPAGDPVPVEVWIDSPTGAGIIGWGVSLQWDPAVLELEWLDDIEGSWLSDWTTAYPWPDGTLFLHGAIVTADGIATLTSCGIINWPDLPYGVGADGIGHLVTFNFTSLSETAYSPLDLIDFDCIYGNHTDLYPTDIVIDGHYNKPYDVAIVNVTSSKTEAYQGCPVNINVTAMNNGSLTVTFNVIVHYSDVALTLVQWETFWSLGDIDGDGYITPLDYYLWDEANGTSPGDPDWNPCADLDQDYIVDLDDYNIWLANVGKDIWSYFGIVGGGIGWQPVNNLLPGASITLFFTCDTTPVPFARMYAISAKTSCIPGETYPADNILADGWILIKIPGDIDGDGHVGFYDFWFFCGYYPSTPALHPLVDLNCDGAINFDDFWIFAGYYPR